MEDFPARLADLLESVTARIRALTVDRADKAITVVALSFAMVVLALLAVVFLFMTIHGALAVPLGTWGAFAVLGGLFLVGGALLWAKRID